MRLRMAVLAAVVAVAVLAVPASAQMMWSFSWTGVNIQGEESFGTGASGSGVFTLVGSELTLHLTSTSSMEHALGHMLAGAVWDMTGMSITSGQVGVGTSARIAGGSSLVGEIPPGWSGNDLSGEWAWNQGDLESLWDTGYRPPGGSIGEYGVSGIGNGAFGAQDLFDTGATNWFGGTPPDGPDGMIVGPGNPLNTDGLPGVAFIENRMAFRWQVAVSGTPNITNFNPFFGTDGAFAIPEPGAVFLLGFGLAGIGFVSLKRRKIG